MNGYILGSIGLLGAMLWLVILIATSFNPLAVCVGLLAALLVTGDRAHSRHTI